MDNLPKKARIRSSDLKRGIRIGTCNDSKYDFKKVIELKGKGRRDSRRKGRPPGIKSSKQSTLTPSNNEVLVEREEHSIIQSDSSERSCTHLTEEEAYCNLLKENGAVYSVDEKFMVYVMQDFDSDRVHLKASKFQIVTRRGMSFVDSDSHWIYKCSCDTVTSEIIDCCVDKMEVPFNDFKSRISECLHSRTLSSILAPFDAQNLIIPDIAVDDNEDFFMDENECDQPSSLSGDLVTLKEGLFLINSKKGYGIIQQTVDGHRCITCNSTICRCIHLNVFFTFHGEGEIQKTQETHPYQQTCYSKEKIPFSSNARMQEMYHRYLLDRFPLRGTDDIIELHPEADVCDVCGHNLEERNPGLKANIFVVSQVLEARVSSKKCPNCEKQFDFDGLSLCVLNMGRNIYCHQILRRFMYYFLTGKTTIYTEYTVLKKTFFDSGFVNIGDKMGYQDFKEAWYAFLNLLDIDYQGCFECPGCGPDPDTVVMDATSVAFRKEMISWKNVFSSGSDNLKPYDKIDTARVKERTLFSRPVRLLLMDYLKPVKGLLVDQRQKLLHLVNIENDDAALVCLLEVILKDSVERGGRYFASDIWRDFIKVLASPYPLCSFLPPNDEFFDFFNNILSMEQCVFQNDAHLQKLQTTVPVIFKLLTSLRDGFPFKELKNCLPHLHQKVFDPFLKDMCPSEEADEEDDLSFFPSLPKIRRRGLFIADKQGSKLKEDFCSKFSKGHPSLLPGVFTMFCPHGVCYGFQVMKLHESPDVPFTLLRTRFRQAPKLVIYDNACTLQVYSLNRDPTFFIETEFRVDGLHFKNHKACGPSFELKSYPQYAQLNSQVVEQANSRLQRIKGSLSYMTQGNFMNHCKFYLWGQNHEVISKSQN